MTQSSWKDEAVRLSSLWLDTDAEPTAPARDSSANRSYFEHLADLQLIDALLSNMSKAAGIDKEKRIRAVMDAIGDATPTRLNRRRLRPWYPLAALAAGLLITCVAFWLQFSRATVAEELLHKIGEVSLESTDRVYNLKRLVSSSGKLREYGGRLYLRGVEGFVVETGDVVFGRHEHEFWLVAADGSTVVAEDFEWLVSDPDKGGYEIALLRELSIESRDVPLMELPSVIKIMRSAYDVELQTGKRFGQHRVDELTGTRRSMTSDLPKTIRLWSGRDSRVIYRAEFSWERGEDTKSNNLVLELRTPEIVPDGWYHPDAHRNSDQPIRRVSSGS